MRKYSKNNLEAERAESLKKFMLRRPEIFSLNSPDMTDQLSTHAKTRSRSLMDIPNNIPAWLSPKALSTVVKPSCAIGNEHCIKGLDYLNVQWPMPLMFGSELYSFSLIDIPDERFAEETAVMSAKLMKLFYDSQIVEGQWRQTYKQFVGAETRKAKLTPGVSIRSKEKAEKDLEAAKAQLLRLQDQRDLYNSIIHKIYDRCAQIKASLLLEKGLQELRDDLTGVVMSVHPPDDPLWTSEFDVTISME